MLANFSWIEQIKGCNEGGGETGIGSISLISTAGSLWETSGLASGRGVIWNHDGH